MAMTLVEIQEAVSPTAGDVLLAKESGHRLAELLAYQPNQVLQVRIESVAAPGESIPIPFSVFRMLSSILNEMAKGNAVTLTPVQTELTTQQAAELLNVSQPYMIEQLEKGLIPHRKVGSERRVLFVDLLDFKQTIDRNRLTALEELSAIDQELGLGY
jgi:excisionase family DNA binding protein